jgi:hypothetical protein
VHLFTLYHPPVKLITSTSSRNVSANKRNACTPSPCITIVIVSLSNPEERLNPILTQISLAASPVEYLLAFRPNFNERTNSHSAHPKRDDPLHLQRYIDSSSSAFIDSIRFSSPSPALHITVESSEQLRYQSLSGCGDAPRSKAPSPELSRDSNTPRLCYLLHIWHPLLITVLRTRSLLNILIR